MLTHGETMKDFHIVTFKPLVLRLFKDMNNVPKVISANKVGYKHHGICCQIV